MKYFIIAASSICLHRIPVVCSTIEKATAKYGQQITFLIVFHEM